MISGIKGSSEAGCLDSNNFHAVSLFGAKPSDVSILHAFPELDHMTLPSQYDACDACEFWIGYFGVDLVTLAHDSLPSPRG